MLESIFSLLFKPGQISSGISSLFYLGPETLMPLASILAAVLGFLLIFWRAIAKGVKQLFQKGKSSAEVTAYVEPQDDEDIDSGSG